MSFVDRQLSVCISQPSSTRQTDTERTLILLWPLCHMHTVSHCSPKFWQTEFFQFSTRTPLFPHTILLCSQSFSWFIFCYFHSFKWPLAFNFQLTLWIANLHCFTSQTNNIGRWSMLLAVVQTHSVSVVGFVRREGNEDHFQQNCPFWYQNENYFSTLGCPPPRLNWPIEQWMCLLFGSSNSATPCTRLISLKTGNLFSVLFRTFQIVSNLVSVVR